MRECDHARHAQHQLAAVVESRQDQHGPKFTQTSFVSTRASRRARHHNHIDMCGPRHILVLIATAKLGEQTSTSLHDVLTLTLVLIASILCMMFPRTDTPHNTPVPRQHPADVSRPWQHHLTSSRVSLAEALHMTAAEEERYPQRRAEPWRAWPIPTTQGKTKST